VRLDNADHNVNAVATPGLRRQQHFKGLADAGRRTEKDLQAATDLPLRFLQELLRGGTAVEIRIGVGHGSSVWRA